MHPPRLADVAGFESLAPQLLDEVYQSKRPWTERMDRAFSRLPAAGVTPEDLLRSVAQAPLPADIARALRLVHETPGAVSCILSDSNTLFIDAVLAENGLADVFEAGIQTNPATIVDVSPAAGEASSEPVAAARRISVRPFCPAVRRPHRCSDCSANMCKGELVRETMARHAGGRFCYVGDGRNDFCGCRQLPEGSFALPRAGFPLARMLAREPIPARVAPWGSPAELLASIKNLIGELL
jgi:pyridoxal phosphate phosphatase PHOSPHO2